MPVRLELANGISDTQRKNAHDTLADIAHISERLQITLARANANLQAVTVARGRLDRLVVASGALLTKSIENDAIDARLEDWLYGHEPGMCLRVLTEMARLIEPEDGRLQMGKWGCGNVYSVMLRPREGMDTAMKLFNDQWDLFHVLSAVEMWDWKLGVDVESRLVELPLGMEMTRGDPRAHQLRSSVGPAHTEKKRQWEMGASPIAAHKMRRIANEEKTDEAVDPKKLNVVLDWLNGFSCGEKHADVVSLRQRDTCTWLSNTPEYQVWRNSDDSFLWLHGKAGAGKTVLAAFAIKTIKETLAEGESIAFFYCDFRDERTTTATGVLCSILSQLLRKLRNATGQGLIQLVDEMLDGKDDGTFVLKHAHTVPFVSRIAKQFSRQPLVIIDALEECNDLENLLRSLRRLMDFGGIRLLVTSRPLPLIKDEFKTLPFISMERMANKVAEDIKLHVTREVEGDRRLRIIEEDLKNEIYDTLLRGADGMFRWIQCQLDTLKRCATRRDLLSALNGLPSGLEETYERILRATDPESSEGRISRSALTWLVAALRPLQLVEILEALSIHLVERRLDPGIAPIHASVLLDVLGSLVVYNEKTGVVNLSHFTVKEYLIGALTREKLTIYHIDLRAAHTRVLRLCMCYIAAVIKDKSLHNVHGVLSQSPPLFDYVFLYGFDHLKYIDPEDAIVLDDMITLRSDIQQHHNAWVNAAKLAHLPLGLSPAHDFIVCILITSLPESSLSIFLRRSHFKATERINPLVYATYFGRVEHAKVLLSHGISIDSTGLDLASPRFVSPLEVAFYRSNRLLFDLFLEDSMATVPSQLLSTAFDGRHWGYDLHMVTSLLQCDGLLEWAADGECQNLLRALDKNVDQNVHLAEENVLTVLRRIIQVGCDLSTPDSLQSVLRIIFYAISKKYLMVLYLIWSHQVPIPSRALLSQGTTLVQELTLLGLDVHVVMTNGDLAFQRAFGQCKHGVGCWTVDCDLCSVFLQSTVYQSCLPVDLLFVGRKGSGKSSVIDMITRNPHPQGLPTATRTSDSFGVQPICHAVHLENLLFQVWDTPGFDEALNGQRINSQIQEWILHISPKQRKQETGEIPSTIQVVWCMRTSDMDDLVAWRQFRDIYECRPRKFPLLIVLTQATSTPPPTDLKILCENRIRELSLPVGEVLQDLVNIRRHEGVSSPEYKEDSLTLRQTLRQHMFSLLRDLLDHSQELDGGSYKCNWAVDSPTLLGPGFVCSRSIRLKDVAKHLRLFHHVQTSSNKTICRWVGCGKHMRTDSMIRHVREQHFAWKYICPVCSDLSSRKHLALAHLERHFSAVPSD